MRADTRVRLLCVQRARFARPLCYNRYMYVDAERLKTFLLDSGLLSRDALLRAERDAVAHEATLSMELVRTGALSEDSVRRAEAYVLGIPFIRLVGQKIDPAVLSLIPEPIARMHHIVAYRKDAGTLEVAMLDVGDLEAVDFVRKKVGLKVLPRLTDNESIKTALLQYHKSLKAEFGDIIQAAVTSLKDVSGKNGGDDAFELKRLAEDLPVVRIVNTLLEHAIIQSASDIHIEPMEKELLVRYRIDGILHDAMSLPRTAMSAITARIKVLAGLKLDEKRLPQDGRFKLDAGGQNVSFRVSLIPTYFGEKTVMRLLREQAQGFTLEGLGFHGEGLERIIRATRQKTGMILVTGPTGSGKTTTLYTILDLLNTPEVNIATIEDPVEYQMARINQTQVKPDIGFTFAAGLRSLLRQDPDIIMVGEIRDKETASLAINAALTGHLVLSTLHTNSAAAAIPRLIDMGIEPFLLVSTLNVVVAQRLVRQLCMAKDKVTLDPAELDSIAEHINEESLLKTLRDERVVAPNDTWKTVSVYHPKITPDCETGYQSRRGIHEVLQISPTIKELVMKGATSDEIEVQARKDGMMTMIEDGVFKSVRGDTTIEEVLRVISE